MRFGQFVISAAIVLLPAACLAAPPALYNPFESIAPPAPACEIDRLVFGRLQKLGIEPAYLCSDSVFVRRAYFDLIGTIPTLEEVRDFLNDKSPAKRAALIDKLLARDEFADYWSMKWADLLRVKAEFPINLWPNAVQCYYRWIRTSIRDNKPYDKFVRELLTTNGSNFRVGQVNFYRAVQGHEPANIAQAVALTFMGVRTDNWSKEKLAQLSVFFAQLGYKSTAEWKEEIVYHDLTKNKLGKTIAATFPDGATIQIPPDTDPREAFAKWLITPANPYFNKAIANRAWYWIMGRGIIHEPDDIRESNPPSNPELLAYLEKELVAGKYDMKHLFRVIMNSSAYQFSSIPHSTHPQAEANFAYYPLRRLEAEVIVDAVCQITGTHEKYSSPIPEPFTFIPEEIRSIALADGSITSSFLEMFGRPARDTGLESERNNRPTPAQRLHMLNSSHIQKKIEFSRKLQGLFSTRSSPRENINNLYLTILSRYPTDEELKVITAYNPPGSTKGRESIVDITWALINSPEFLYRH